MSNRSRTVFRIQHRSYSLCSSLLRKQMNLTFRLPDGKMSVRDRGFMVVKEMEDEVRIRKLVVDLKLPSNGTESSVWDSKGWSSPTCSHFSFQRELVVETGR